MSFVKNSCHDIKKLVNLEKFLGFCWVVWADVGKWRGRLRHHWLCAMIDVDFAGDKE